ncbi:hypothetical protein Poli38472_003837 [Pythium oligandrum]|uniref:DNA-(apurinic or apyrimidinic site) lyase n=1 Tax=Pythium oligandrum TaxID=41045 RepID=A0A8K1CP80_PYTOL|nr:hypothetical protein Poli38472_003837 [Pythium oligandrum]|eukprot:TMW66072.1 hypothetical protein Poli38472_003837 [Pythium oligandrum]
MRRSTRIAQVATAVTANASLIASTSATKLRGKRSHAPAAGSGEVRGSDVVKREQKKIKAEVIKTEVKFDAVVAMGALSHQGLNINWQDLCSVQELSCVVTLTSGQVFTWQQDPKSGHWTGVVERNVFKLREHDQRVQFHCMHPPHLTLEEARQVLHDYFRLEVEAAPLYKLWSEKDDDMSKVIRSLPGLRIIRQDPVECLYAFICSSNNNILRITHMVNNLKKSYGELLLHDVGSDVKYYSFPSVDALVKQADEVTLRALGFGYRAPFIIKTSQQLQAHGGRDFLLQLRQVPPQDGLAVDLYAEKLMTFAGIGRKVADCIGLFSLNKLDAIPVDTHVWQIACREFDPSLKHKKSLTPTIYQAVGDHFRARFSPMAGWAHSVLFTGDLSSFQSHLPEEVQRKKPSSKKAKRTSSMEQTTVKKVKQATQSQKAKLTDKTT